MTDLPNYLPGIPPMYGVKQLAPEASQGEDIIVPVELTLDGEPLLDVTGWILEAFVKKSLKAIGILWKGELGNGIEHKAENLYYFRIPHSVSALFLPGSYYYAVRGTQKPATGVGFDRMANLAQGMLNVALSASSPNPKLEAETMEVVYYDPASGRTIVRAQYTELTEPQSPPPFGNYPVW